MQLRSRSLPALPAAQSLPLRPAWSALALGALLLSAGVQAGETQRLFDGRSFAGWEGDTQKTWRIVDQALVGGSLAAPVPRNEFLCTTRAYTNFVLRLEFKLLGRPQANAGIQFRSRRVPNHHEVSGYQADLGDPEWWGCLYDESRRNRVLAKADPAKVLPQLRADGWNEYVIRAEGPRVQLWINGTPTVDYTEADADIPQSGLIGLQIHGGPPSEAWYRNLTIEELPPGNRSADR